MIEKDVWLSQKWVSIVDVIIDAFDNNHANSTKVNKYVCYIDHSYLFRDFNQLNIAVEYLEKNNDVSSIIFHNIPDNPIVELDKESSNCITEQLLAPLQVRKKENFNEAQILSGYGTFFNKELIASGEIIGKRTHHIPISNPNGITVRDYDTLNLFLSLKDIDI